MLFQMLQLLWICNGFHPIFIYICIKMHIFSPFANLVSCSFLTSWLYSLSCLSYGDVIYGTSYLCSLSCVSCGIIICGISIVYLVACTIVGIAFTTINSANGSTMPLIIFYAFISMLSYSLFTPKLEAPPSQLYSSS